MNKKSYSVFTSGSGLFNDYLNDFPKVEGFYAGDPKKSVSYNALYEKLQKNDYSRTMLVEILGTQNLDSGDPDILKPLLEKLSDPSTVTVVTGQQAGLFLGPLYTVYKALTAVRLAEELGEKYGIPAVPVFWIEVDDHDFDEVRKFSVFSPSGEIRNMEYDDSIETDLLPVSQRAINQEFRKVFEELAGIFGETENAVETLGILKRIYKEGTSLAVAFKEFFRTFFPDIPILFIDPSDPRIKKHAKPLFEDLISRKNEIETVLNRSYDELKIKEYNPQVGLRNGLIRLFYFDGDHRKRLSEEETGTNIHDFVERSFPGLSGDVLSRPLFQDFVLPTIAYVAGPSELAYMGQLKSLYGILGMNMPLVFPRWSGTIVDKKTKKNIDRLDFQIIDFLENTDKEITDRIFAAKDTSDYDGVFERTEIELQTNLDNIKELAGKIDNSLENMVESQGNKIKFQVEKIREKVMNALKNSDKQAHEKIRRVSATILPGGKPQERVFSMLNYLMRYGREFPEFIKEIVTTDTDKHHIKEI